MTVKYFGPNIYTGNNKQILESPDDDFEQDVEEATLVLNQGLSTPYDAAQRESNNLNYMALAVKNLPWQQGIVASSPAVTSYVGCVQLCVMWC